MKNNEVLKNFYGLSFYNQIKIFDEFLKVFENYKNKKLRRELLYIFEEYIKSKIEYNETYNSIDYLEQNDIKKINIFTDDYYMEMCLLLDNKEKTLNQELYEFDYFIGSKYPVGYNTNLKRSIYFFKQPNDSEVDEFLNYFDKKNVSEQFRIISEFIDYYSPIKDLPHNIIPDKYNIITSFNEKLESILNKSNYNRYLSLNDNDKLDYIRFLGYKIEDLTIIDKSKLIEDNPKSLKLHHHKKKNRYHNLPKNIRK